MEGKAMWDKVVALWRMGDRVSALAARCEALEAGNTRLAKELAHLRQWVGAALGRRKGGVRDERGWRLDKDLETLD